MYIPDLIHIHRKPNNFHSYFTCIIYFHCMKTKYRVSFKIDVYMLLSIDCLKLNESQNPFYVKKKYTNTLYWFNIQWFIGSNDQCWLCTYGALEILGYVTVYVTYMYTGVCYTQYFMILYCQLQYTTDKRSLSTSNYV